MEKLIAFDETIQKWIVFYTTDRITYDYKTGEALSPIMCDYHDLAQFDTKAEAELFVKTN